LRPITRVEVRLLGNQVEAAAEAPELVPDEVATLVCVSFVDLSPPKANHSLPVYKKHATSSGSTYRSPRGLSFGALLMDHKWPPYKGLGHQLDTTRVSACSYSGSEFGVSEAELRPTFYYRT